MNLTKKCVFVGDELDFFYKRIRRRGEPPIQSFQCRTDRKGRFVATDAAHGLVRGDDVSRSETMACTGQGR